MRELGVRVDGVLEQVLARGLVCVLVGEWRFELVRVLRGGSRINDDRVTKLSLHHPIS